MLDQRLWRWVNLNTSLGWHFVFSEKPESETETDPETVSRWQDQVTYITLKI